MRACFNLFDSMCLVATSSVDSESSIKSFADLRGARKVKRLCCLFVVLDFIVVELGLKTWNDH